jgi:hypothetical protein
MEYPAGEQLSWRMQKVLSWLLMALMTDIATASEIRFESGPQRTALIELYTSEGCSSCPPAEAWLSRLKNDPGLWKQFVPVAFHVDYWNHLGWRDQFSSKEWTERQSRYAARWHNDSVYTPGFVLNGREWRDWSGKLVPPDEKNVGVVRATSSDNINWSIEFQSTNKDAVDWDAHLVLLGCGIASKISAGENSGRNLLHDFVVLTHESSSMRSDGGHSSSHLTLKSPAEKASRRAIAMWITRHGQLEPVQATGGWLP